MCVCAGERARDGERARLCAPPLVDELVSNQIRYRLPPQLSVKTQSPRRHLSRRHTQTLGAPSPPRELPSPIKLNERHTPFHDAHVVSLSLSPWSHPVRFKRNNLPYQILYCVSLTPGSEGFLIEEKRIRALHSIIFPIYSISAARPGRLFHLRHLQPEKALHNSDLLRASFSYVCKVMATQQVTCNRITVICNM